MPEYRKTFRTYYKFTDEGNRMIVVENKQKASSVRFVEDYTYIGDILIDSEQYKPCTEEEFNAAKSEAMKRLNEEKI